MKVFDFIFRNFIGMLNFITCIALLIDIAYMFGGRIFFELAEFSGIGFFSVENLFTTHSRDNFHENKIDQHFVLLYSEVAHSHINS